MNSMFKVLQSRYFKSITEKQKAYYLSQKYPHLEYYICPVSYLFQTDKMMLFLQYCQVGIKNITSYIMHVGRTHKSKQ